MGLFGRGTQCEDTWANSAANENGSNEKRAFRNFITSREETIMTDDSAFSNSAPPGSSRSSAADFNAAALSHKVELLEQQLKQKDDKISQLRQMMDAEEKVQSERIHILERQLEKLVELSSGECAHRGKASLLLISKGTRGTRDAKLEISALQELSSKLIAEKDRLAFENGNLKNLVKDQNTKNTDPSIEQDFDNRIPPNINELDSLMHKIKHLETKKTALNCRIRKGEGRIEIAGDERSNRRNSESTLKEDANKPQGAVAVESKDQQESGDHQQDVLLYQMSCRLCPKDHSHVKYMGACSTSLQENGVAQNQAGLLPTQLAHAESQLQLKMLLKQHFLQVWDMAKQLQEDPRSISSSVHDSEMSGNDNSGSGWTASSLARHLVKHCRSMKTDKEVLHWCMENVKVEVEKQQHFGENLNDNVPHDHDHCAPSSQKKRIKKKPNSYDECTPSSQEKRIKKTKSWTKSGVKQMKRRFEF